MQPQDTLVIFDAGGILTKIDYREVYIRWSELSGKNTHDEIKALYAQSQLDKALNSGANINFAETVRAKVLDNQTVSDEDIVDAYQLHIIDQIPEMIAFKQSLIAANYQVGILSTTSTISAEKIVRSFPSVYQGSHPDLVQLSYLTHIVKPDPAAYLPFIGRAKQTIYIEDKASYLEPALTLGWHGIHLVAFPDPNEAMLAFPGSEDPLRSISHPNYHRAESLDDAFRIFTELGVTVPET